MVVTAAFTVRGSAGFGGGALATPLLALVLPVTTVLPVVALLLILASVGQVRQEHRDVEWGEVRRIVPGMLVGVGIGLYLLATLDAKPLAKALGVFVMCYAVYALVFAGRTFAVVPRRAQPLAVVLSLAAGVIGALFGGAAGPLYVVYLNALRLAKDRFRATMTVLMMLQGSTRVIGYIGLGLYTVKVFIVLAAALPMVVLGGFLGTHLARRVDQRRFDRVVACVLFASGAVLVVK